MRRAAAVALMLGCGCGTPPTNYDPAGPYQRSEIDQTVEYLVTTYDRDPALLSGYDIWIADEGTPIEGHPDWSGATRVSCKKNHKSIIIKAAGKCFAATSIAHEVAHAIQIEDGALNPCKHKAGEEDHPKEWFGTYGKVAVARDQAVIAICHGITW